MKKSNTDSRYWEGSSRRISAFSFSDLSSSSTLSRQILGLSVKLFGCCSNPAYENCHENNNRVSNSMLNVNRCVALKRPADCCKLTRRVLPAIVAFGPCLQVLGDRILAVRVTHRRDCVCLSCVCESKNEKSTLYAWISQSS